MAFTNCFHLPYCSPFKTAVLLTGPSTEYRGVKTGEACPGYSVRNGSSETRIKFF